MRKKHLVISFLILELLILVGGIWWYRFSQAATSLPKENGKVILEGRVGSEPTISGQNISFKINDVPVIGKSDDTIEFGDLVLVEGIEATPNRISKATITQIEEHNTFSPLIFLTNLRIQLAKIPYQYLPSNQASLVAGAVIGVKDKSNKQFMSALRRTGTIHIVVVSGANLTMVAAFLLGFKKLIGRNNALILSLVLIWFYAVLTGLQPPVLRSAIMVSFTFIATLFGKQYWDIYGLLLAAAIMLFIKPLLISDISFQLSFSATLGIILFGNKFGAFFHSVLAKVKFKASKVPFSIMENLSTTFAAQLLVDPLILYHFHQVSFISPIVNVLVLPVVLFITLAGFVLVILGAVSSILGTILGFAILIPASYFVWVVSLFGHLSFASKTFHAIPGSIIVGYYLVLGVISFYIFLQGRKARVVTA